MHKDDPPAPADLLAALGSERDAYRQLLALTTRERDVLQQGDLVAVASIVRDKKAMMSPLAHHAATRTRSAAMLAEGLGLPGDCGLPDVIAHLDDASAGELQRVRLECIGIVEHLQTLNRGNDGLIHARLDRVEATLDFLSRSATVCDGHYTLSGATHAQPSTGHVLNWQI